MKIWNFVAFAQVYQQPEYFEERERKYFDLWLNHVSRYGNRQYDSPTYCGVDMRILCCPVCRFSTDPDIQSKARAA